MTGCAVNYHFDDDVAKLIANLSTAIGRELAEFETATGVMPSRIDVPMLSARTHGDRVSRYVVGKIDVTFTL